MTIQVLDAALDEIEQAVGNYNTERPGLDEEPGRGATGRNRSGWLGLSVALTQQTGLLLRKNPATPTGAACFQTLSRENLFDDHLPGRLSSA
jgi:hypothetical protein